MRYRTMVMFERTRRTCTTTSLTVLHDERRMEDGHLNGESPLSCVDLPNAVYSTYIVRIQFVHSVYYTLSY